MELWHLNQQILKAKYKAEIREEPQPQFIYMGAEQYETFSREVHSLHNTGNDPASLREEYMGLEVIRVHARKHFNIA